MEARTVNNLPLAAAAHDDAERCPLAIELSKKSWIVAVHTPVSDKISRYTLEGCDWKSLLGAARTARGNTAREAGRPRVRRAIPALPRPDTSDSADRDK